jgi:glutamate-5-semialdehyde dehydrogenase
MLALIMAASTNLSPLLQRLGHQAKDASAQLAQTPSHVIQKCLLWIADQILHAQDDILSANKMDLLQAQEKNLSPALLDRLLLTQDRLLSLSQSVRLIANLPAPINHVLQETKRPNGLLIQKISVPLGVLGMIYESRPNVTMDASALALRSHNAIILRGGSESLHSSLALINIIQDGLIQFSLPLGAVSMIDDPDRAYVTDMLHAKDFIDLMIPRGGKGLTKLVADEAKMPILYHLDGLCHTYIDCDADMIMARDITVNAKMRRTGICGATETLLIHEKCNSKVVQAILSTLHEEGCEIRADEKTKYLFPSAKSATEDDWATEYLDKILSVKMVSSVADAVDHINFYGSHHTDAIITANSQTAQYFLDRVDSAIVLHNASTQFADGGEFGMGAEIGIATGRFHARGPVGLEQLCTYKYKIFGSGQTRPS